MRVTAHHGGPTLNLRLPLTGGGMRVGHKERWSQAAEELAS